MIVTLFELCPGDTVRSGNIGGIIPRQGHGSETDPDGFLSSDGIVIADSWVSRE
jgi:hypothetical protein